MEKMPSITVSRAEKSHISMREIYSDDSYVTLYRYEKPTEEYAESREGTVSKREIVGQWFTDNVEGLKTYIKMREPGGIIVTVRVPMAELKRHNATLREDTKDMDIEDDNFIIGPDIQEKSRLEIPLEVNARLGKKFSFNEYQHIDAFVDRELTPESLLQKVEK
jgi:hypothetical protein